VAGFNLLNEPHDPSKNQLRPFYQRVIEAIRAVDPEPVIFLDGNRFATDFTHFDPPFENTVYSIHDYPAPGGTGAVDYPGIYGGELVDKEKLRSNIRRMCQYMIDRNLPIWVGEFGSHYTEDPVIDARRRQVALDQIAAFEELEAHWCLWPYKNIGVQDVVHLAPDSPWMTRVKPILEKKARLCVDIAFPGTTIQPLLQPIEDLMTREFPEYDPPPWGAKSRIGRLMRSILLSEPLIPEFADLFKAMSETEIDEMMKSFLFERCIPRNELAASLKIICGARETN